MINQDIWKRSRISSFPSSVPTSDYSNYFNAFNSDLVFQRSPSGISNFSSNSTVESDAPIAHEIKSCKLKSINGRFTVSFFENLNREIYSLISEKTPSIDAIKKQGQLLKYLEKSFQDIIPNCIIDHFNSTNNSRNKLEVDMDIIISVSDNYTIPLESINILAHVANSVGMKSIRVPQKPRIPLIFGIDSFSGFRVNLGLDSKSSIKLLQLFRIYSLLDSRFDQLLLIVKYWFSTRIYTEKAFGILPRSTYIFLVLFLCQNRGVLPVLQEFTENLSSKNCAYTDFGWKSRNSESLGELLVAFFKYFSSDFPYVHGVLSIRTGSILSKDSKGWTKENQHIVNHRGVKDRYWFCIEHPLGNFFLLILDIYYNLCTTIDKESLYEFRGEFIRASKIICGSNSDSDEGILNLIMKFY